jgi:phosphate acetyltransferase
MADMFAPLVAQLKANPKTIVFTEGNDPRILEAASKLLAEGVLKVVMVGNEAECKAAAAAGNFDISAAEIIDPENYAGFDEMVNTMVELRKGKQTAEECTALLKKSVLCWSRWARLTACWAALPTPPPTPSVPLCSWSRPRRALIW